MEGASAAMDGGVSRDKRFGRMKTTADALRAVMEWRMKSMGRVRLSVGVCVRASFGFGGDVEGIWVGGVDSVVFVGMGLGDPVALGVAVDSAVSVASAANWPRKFPMLASWCRV